MFFLFCTTKLKALPGVDHGTPIHMGTLISVDIGVKHLALCVLSGSGPQHDIREWRVVDIPEPHDAGALFDCLNPTWAEWAEQAGGATRVVVERQPPQSALMQRIQNYCEMLSVVHGMEVTVLHARAKLKFAATQPYFAPPAAAANTYRDRKRCAVDTVANYLDAQPDTDAWTPWKLMYSNAKKKDDLADALLQALAIASAL